MMTIFKVNSSGNALQSSISPGMIASLVLALILPLMLGLFAESLLWYIGVICYFVIIFFPFFVLISILYEWKQGDVSLGSSILKRLVPLPPGYIYGSDLKNDGYPIATIALIAVNIIVFLLLPEEWYDHLVFLPVGDPGSLHIFASVFTHAFLHGSLSHLSGNMVFLWAFGSGLELRIGPKRYIGFYFAAIVGSGLLVFLLLNIKATNIGSNEIIDNFRSLGASGAVSGIMGLFVVRCYFARIKMSVWLITIPFPWLALYHFSIPLRIKAPVLVGLYFAFDLSGSVEQFSQQGSVNYWSHVGGYLTCMFLGLLLGLHREASDDAFKTRANRCSKDNLGKNEAENMYGQILTRDPDNLEALTFIFSNQHNRNSDDAGTSFSKLLKASADQDFDKAISLCREYLPQYLSFVPPGLGAKIGLRFYRNCEFIHARYCLELAADAEGPWQPKAMMMLAQTFAALENINLARKIYEKVVERFTGTLFEDEARKQLTGLSPNSEAYP